MKLKDAKILLTGATGGIGGKLARRLAERGARLALVDRQAEALQVLLDDLGGAGHQALAADLSSVEGCEAVSRRASETLGGVDILINLAGLMNFDRLSAMEPQAIQRLFQVNLLAPVLLSRALIPVMAARGRGQVVNIGSTFGSIGFAWFSTYSASKAGLRGFSEALRRELIEDGIGVTYIAPRAVKTTLNSEQVVAMGKATGMHMDEAGAVAGKIVAAIERDAKEVYLGWPESLFVRINALLPRLVDRALRRQNTVATQYLPSRAMD